MRLRRSLIATQVVAIFGFLGLAITPTATADGFPPPSNDGIVLLSTTYAEVPELDAVEELLGVNLDKPAKITGSCTGWVAKVMGNEALIVTARHCVDMEYGKNAINRIAGKSVDVTRMVTAVKASTLDGEFTASPRVAQVLDVMPVENGDVAILRVSGLAQPLVPLPLAPSQGKVGDKVATVGFPASPSHTSPRLITTYGALTSESSPIEPNGEYVVTSDASTSNGASGGPIVNRDGQVVAMTSKGYKGMDVFTYPVDWFTLVNFLGRHGIQPLSESVVVTTNDPAVANMPDIPTSSANGSLADLWNETWDGMTSDVMYAKDKGVQGYNWIDDAPAGIKVALSFLVLLLVYVWWVRHRLNRVAPPRKQHKKGVSHRR